MQQCADKRHFGRQETTRNRGDECRERQERQMASQPSRSSFNFSRVALPSWTFLFTYEGADLAARTLRRHGVDIKRTARRLCRLWNGRGESWTRKLAYVWTRLILVLVSCDLCHYPSPPIAHNQFTPNINLSAPSPFPLCPSPHPLIGSSRANAWHGVPVPTEGVFQRRLAAGRRVYRQQPLPDCLRPAGPPANTSRCSSAGIGSARSGRSH